MAGVGGDVPCFDGLLDSDQPKDTEVIIMEEGSGDPAQRVGRKRARGGAADTSIRVGAHWLVLWSLSPYFRAKLERWSDSNTANKKPRQQQEGRDQEQAGPAQQSQQHQPYRYTLQLLVPPGQLELGRRLITAMYSSSPDLSDLQVPQVMQLVLLADCYGVGKVISAAAAALQQLTANHMQLDTAVAVFELPLTCLSLDALKPVQRIAADSLHSALGDLEVVWGSTQKQQQLLGLPSSALMQLLIDPRTKVASEDTAVYTASAWLKAHHAASAGRLQQQLPALLRLPYCTATFLASLAGDGPTLDTADAWVCGGSTRMLADLLAASGRNSSERSKWLRNRYLNHPAWRLPARPVSGVTHLTFPWQLPLAVVEQMFADAAAPGVGPVGGTSQHSIWQGRAWSMSVGVVRGRISVYLHSKGAEAYFDGALMMYTTARSCKGIHSFSGSHVDSGGLGSAAVEWDAAWEWPQVHALLCQGGLVHPDGCLHLRAAVTRVS